MPVTIRDVARVAGVSKATVSRVLNNTKNVRPATRRKVEEAFRRLDYRPHRLARSLAKGRTMALGVVVRNLHNPAMVQIIHAAEDVARQHGYRLLIISTYEDPELEVGSYRELMERQVDGIVLWTRRPSPELLGLIATGPPAVSMGVRFVGQRVGVVFADVERAARDMAQHLVSLGHRRIALLAGPPDYEHAVRLQQGLAHGIEDAGLELPPDMVVTAGVRSETGYEAARELLARPPIRQAQDKPRPDAVFAYNDLVAAGALMACRELGLLVPQDIAVVGCEDSLLARLLEPPLTTIHIPLAEMGTAAIELLLVLMRGEEPESREVAIPCSLTIRESCGAAAQYRASAKS